MSFDPTGFFGGKLAGFILDLGKKTFGKSTEVVRFLREHGYASLEDDFETLYVHALASRRHRGSPASVLKVFQRTAAGRSVTSSAGLTAKPRPATSPICQALRNTAPMSLGWSLPWRSRRRP